MLKTLPISRVPGLSAAGNLLATVTAPLQKTVFEQFMNLPPTVQRRIAGAPVRLDGQELAPDTQLMLRLMRLTGQPDAWTLPVEKARRALLAQSLLGGGAAHPIGRVSTVESPVGKGRLYVPTGAPETGPMLIFIHGGGFFLGDLDSHDAPCRVLAEQSGVRVLSVEYRLAPEHPFPAAYDDALAVFDWAVERAGAFGADPARIGVGGDSAGGSLAASVALAAGERCAFQLLIYPVTQMDATTRSRELFSKDFFLTAEAIDICARHYVPDGTDPRDPRLSPFYAEVPAGVAPAYVATAGFDPLRDEGEAYAEKLREAGVEVTVKRFPDQIHGFLNIVGAGHTARAAVSEIAGVLRANL